MTNRRSFAQAISAALLDRLAAAIAALPPVVVSSAIGSFCRNVGSGAERYIDCADFVATLTDEFDRHLSEPEVMLTALAELERQEIKRMN